MPPFVLNHVQLLIASPKYRQTFTQRAVMPAIVLPHMSETFVNVKFCCRPREPQPEASAFTLRADMPANKCHACQQFSLTRSAVADLASRSPKRRRIVTRPRKPVPGPSNSDRPPNSDSNACLHQRRDGSIHSLPFVDLTARTVFLCFFLTCEPEIRFRTY